jgi:hypothetical protein
MVYGFKGKSPCFLRWAFSISTSIVPDWEKLSCNVDVIDDVWVMLFLGLTSVFAGEFGGRVCKYLTVFDLAGSRGRRKAYPRG